MKACVDIGGTKVAVSLSDGKDFLARRAEPTVVTGTPKALSQQVARMVNAACAEAGVPRTALQAVGVSSCGPFVRNAGAVELATPNICGGLAGPARGLPNDWTTVPLEAPLRATWGVPVRVENDAIAALEAERRWGALQGVADCAYVTWSTGVGVGLCVDGRVLHGKNGNAGHAGHIFVSDDTDALCGCGNVGDVEAIVAGNSVARRFGADAAQFMAAARAGEAAANAQLDELCRVMGRMLYNLVATLDLSRISIGGSLFWHHRELLLPRLVTELEGKLPALTRGVELLEAGLGDRVGDFAALALVS
jgi:glucokinase